LLDLVQQLLFFNNPEKLTKDKGGIKQYIFLRYYIILQYIQRWLSGVGNSKPPWNGLDDINRVLSGLSTASLAALSLDIGGVVGVVAVYLYLFGAVPSCEVYEAPFSGQTAS